MPFDGGHALKCMIDFFPEARDILNRLFQIVEVAADRFQFAFHARRHELLTCPSEAVVRLHSMKVIKATFRCANALLNEGANGMD